jgi:hypothetical protein
MWVICVNSTRFFTQCRGQEILSFEAGASGNSVRAIVERLNEAARFKNISILRNVLAEAPIEQVILAFGYTSRRERRWLSEAISSLIRSGVFTKTVNTQDAVADTVPLKVTAVVFTITTPSEALFEVRWRSDAKELRDIERHALDAFPKTFIYKVKNLRRKAYEIVNSHALKVGDVYFLEQGNLPKLVGELEALRKEYATLDEEVSKWFNSPEGRQRIREVKDYVIKKYGVEPTIKLKPAAGRLDYNYTYFVTDETFVDNFLQDIKARAREEIERMKDEAREKYEEGLRMVEEKAREAELMFRSRILDAVEDAAKRALSLKEGSKTVLRELLRIKNVSEGFGVKSVLLETAIEAFSGNLDASKHLARMLGTNATENLEENLLVVCQASENSLKHPFFTQIA